MWCMHLRWILVAYSDLGKGMRNDLKELCGVKKGVHENEWMRIYFDSLVIRKKIDDSFLDTCV